MAMTTPQASIDEDVQIGERVHTLMWRAKRSQTSLGRAIGVDQGLLSKKLRGSVRWYAGELAAVARTMHTTVAYLYGETDDPRPPALPRLDSNQQPSGIPLLLLRGPRVSLSRVLPGRIATVTPLAPRRSADMSGDGQAAARKSA